MHQLGPEADNCNAIHGHNYLLEVSVYGGNGYIELDECVNRQILQKFDRRFLNNVVQETSGECLVAEIFVKLKADLGDCLLRVGLQETQKNRFDAFTTDLRIHHSDKGRDDQHHCENQSDNLNGVIPL
jgi:6-pyruvoyl-tetrahydropterin synthase